MIDENEGKKWSQMSDEELIAEADGYKIVDGQIWKLDYEARLDYLTDRQAVITELRRG